MVSEHRKRTQSKEGSAGRIQGVTSMMPLTPASSKVSLAAAAATVSSVSHPPCESDHIRLDQQSSALLATQHSPLPIRDSFLQSEICAIKKFLLTTFRSIVLRNGCLYLWKHKPMPSTARNHEHLHLLECCTFLVPYRNAPVCTTRALLSSPVALVNSECS